MAARKKTRRPKTSRTIVTTRKGSEATQLLLPVTPRGATGLKRTAGFVYDEWHPKLSGAQAIKIYREMSDNDAVIGSFLYALNAYARAAEVKIAAYDDSNQASLIADHVQTCVDDMSMTRREFTGDVLSMAWAGFSWHEIVYKVRRGSSPLQGLSDQTVAKLRKSLMDEKLRDALGKKSSFGDAFGRDENDDIDVESMLRSKYNDGLVGWRKLPIRAQDTIWEWKFSGSGGIRGAYQQAPPNHKRTFLPIMDGLLFRTSSNKNNPEGRSLLRNSYRNWHFLKKIQEFEAIGIERDMAGMLIFHLPREYFDPDATEDQKATLADYREVNERMRRGEYEGLCYPAEDEGEDGKTGWAARLMQSGGRRPMDTNEIIKRLESRIAISVLGEAVLLGMQGNVGSWALSSDKTEMMAMGIKSILDSIADVMTRYAIPRLVKRCGWPEELSPSWEYSDIETDAATELATSLTGLVSAGLITPDPAIEEYLRIRIGLPTEQEIDLGQAEDSLARMSEEPEGASAEAALQQVVPIAAEADSPSAALSVDQASEFLGLNRNIIMGALRRGQLPGARVGGGWRIMREDLIGYMRGQQAA